MSIAILFLIPVFISPLVALLDYYLLRDHVVLLSGNPPSKWYWLTPCILELSLFTIGLYIGYGISEAGL